MRRATSRAACPHILIAPRAGAQKLCDLGYSSMDIITTLFRVVRNFPDLAEFLKLEFIRVRAPGLPWQLRSSSALGVCAAPATAAPCAAPRRRSRSKSACGRTGERRVFRL